MSDTALLSPLLVDVREPATSMISPRRLADKLHVTLAELAEVARLHRNSLTRSARSPEVQMRLAKIVQILRRATTIAGEDENLAIYWFHYELLAGFDGKRAIDLVKDDKADAVLAFLDMIEHGVPA